MNRIERLTKPLAWLMAFLLAAFMAGCGSSDKSPVTLPSVVSVAVTPATPSIPISGIQQFTATATYSDGLTHDVTAAPGIAWSSDNAAVATVSATGIATGVANGTAVITASIGGQSATANLTVTAATLVSIALTPATPSIPVTTTQPFAAIATYTSGPTIDVTSAPGIVWNTSNAAVATIAATGIATGVVAGTADITADFGGVTSTAATLTVYAATLQSIAVTPATASVPMGITQPFTAIATYDYGPTVDVTTAANWTSGSAGATVGPNTGIATGVTANVTPVVITATYGGQSDTAALTVTPATLQSIAVTPAAPTITVTNTQQFTATATYSDMTTANVTADPGTVWSSSDNGVATVVSTTGLATGVAAGTADITADFGGMTSSAGALTVNAATLISIAVTPATPSIPVAATQQFTAMASYNVGPAVDVTSDPGTVWNSSDNGVATIAATGLATGVAGGTANITADYGGMTSSIATLTVTAAASSVLPGAGANPTVISASPGNLATNVPISSKGVGNAVTGKQLIATFNEAMDPVTINEAVSTTALSTFSLKETVSGNNVPGTVLMSNGDTVATFTPAADLIADTDYTATVSTAAQTAGAAPLSNTVEWTFRTKAGAQTFSQLPLNLGRAATFAIFSNTAVTSVFQSDVQGNVGSAGTGSATTITCPEVTPVGVSTVWSVDATYADAACLTTDATYVGLTAGDLSAAITDAKGRTIPDSVDDQTGLAGDISGLTLTPGLYKWNTGVLVSNAGLTLTGGANDVWIFQISGDLTLQDGAIITLGGNAQAKNIFWQVAGGAGANLGVNVDFKGVVMADAGIQLSGGVGTPTVVNGRLLANSSVTLIMNTITPPAQ